MRFLFLGGLMLAALACQSRELFSTVDGGGGDLGTGASTSTVTTTAAVTSSSAIGAGGQGGSSGQGGAGGVLPDAGADATLDSAPDA